MRAPEALIATRLVSTCIVAVATSCTLQDAAFGRACDAASSSSCPGAYACVDRTCVPVAIADDVDAQLGARSEGEGEGPGSAEGEGEGGGGVAGEGEGEGDVIPPPDPGACDATATIVAAGDGTNCATAYDLASGQVVVGDTTGRSTSVTELGACASFAAPQMLFAMSASAGQHVDVALRSCTDGYWPRVALVDGCGGAVFPDTCHDDALGEVGFSATIPVEGSFYVVVTGYNAGAGDFGLFRLVVTLQ